LQLGPPNQPDLAELLIQVNQNIAPQYEDQSGDFLATLDTAQLMSMMARFEKLEAAIQGAYLGPPSVPTDGVYVPYNNATTNVDLNNKHIVNVAHIGVGTSSTPDTLILAVGDNGSLSRIVMRGYSASTASSAMRVSKYRGTVTAPQVPQSGDSLGQFQFAGYATTSADGSAGAYWEGVTTETWGATANGTKVLLKVTPNTTTTPVTAVTIDQDKSVTFATTASATTFIGALTGIASGNVLSVSGTAPVVSSGGTTPAISMPKATTSVDGYLSSTDWTTFNSKGSGSVTSVAQSFTGGLISVAGSPITTSGTLALTVAGTSGGIPYFSSASTWATSAALAASALVVGGGAGAAPATTTTGTGVVTALGVNTGTAGAFVVNGGALGTPSSGTVTNLTGTASININGTVGATTAATGKFTTIEGTDTTDATSTTAAAVKTAGGLAVAKKVYTGDNIVPAAAKGVNFTGNTPAAGMTSQLLNWYEEGTWTPVFTCATPGDLAFTYGTQQGYYVRKGREVTLICNIASTAFTYTTASGGVKITGLPFTPTISNFVAINAFSNLSMGVGKTGISGQIVGTLPTIYLNKTDLIGGASSAIAITDFGSGGATSIYFTITYFI
jgi:hypothetical protein